MADTKESVSSDLKPFSNPFAGISKEALVADNEATEEKADDQKPLSADTQAPDTIKDDENDAPKSDSIPVAKADALKDEDTSKVDEAKPADTTEKEPEYTEEQFQADIGDYLNTQTNGAIRSFNEIPSILEQNKKLKADLENKELTFPNEAAKKVYEYATKAQGSELSAARQYFHLLSLDLPKMTPKEKQFEAFSLERPNLSREEAFKRFEARYEKMYPDMENDLVQQDDHERATFDAENKLKGMQASHEEAVKQGSKPQETGPTEEQIREAESNIKAALDNFGGISLSFDDSKYGKLDIPMDSGKAAEFMEVLKNPYNLLNSIQERCKDASGNFNYNEYVHQMFRLWNRESIAEREHEHLMTLGKLAEISERKNTPKKELREETSTPAPQTFREAFAGALKQASN